MSLKAGEIRKRANVYYGGQVTSRTVVRPNCDMKTLGIMLPGSYRFTTESAETVDITRGHCRVKIADQQAWSEHQAGDSFSVPAGSHFEIEVDDLLDYVCHYG